MKSTWKYSMDKMSSTSAQLQMIQRFWYALEWQSSTDNYQQGGLPESTARWDLNYIYSPVMV